MPKQGAPNTGTLAQTVHFPILASTAIRVISTYSAQIYDPKWTQTRSRAGLWLLPAIWCSTREYICAIRGRQASKSACARKRAAASAAHILERRACPRTLPLLGTPPTRPRCNHPQGHHGGPGTDAHQREWPQPHRPCSTAAAACTSGRNGNAPVSTLPCSCMAAMRAPVCMWQVDACPRTAPRRWSLRRSAPRSPLTGESLACLRAPCLRAHTARACARHRSRAAVPPGCAAPCPGIGRPSRGAEMFPATWGALHLACPAC